MALTQFKAPVLPTPSSSYDRNDQVQLIRLLELYFGQLDSQTPNWAQSYLASMGFYGYLVMPYTAVTTTYSILTSDCVLNCTSSGFTVTLPTAVGVTGKDYYVKNSTGSGNITVATTGGQTINGVSTVTVLPGVGWDVGSPTLHVVSTGANWVTL